MASPQASLYDRSGQVKATGLAWSETGCDTSVIGDASNTRQTFHLDEPANAAPGISVRVTYPDGTVAVGVVSTADQVTGFVTLVDPLPEVPPATSPFKGLDLFVTIPSSATDALYRGYTLEVSDAAVEETVKLAVNVVKYAYIGPCQARDVRAVIARGYAGELAADETLHQQIADEVNAQIRGRLLASGAYLSSYWDPDALALAKAPMLRLVLAEQHGLREAGSSRDTYLSDLEAKVEARVADVFRSAAVYDTDNSGVVEDDAAKKAFIVDLVL